MFESVCGRGNALVFRNDVPAAAIDKKREIVAIFFKLAGSHVAKSGDARKPLCEQTNTILAFGTALIVGAGGKRVMHHRIANHQRYALRQSNVPVFKGTAVEQQGMRGAPMAGHELIHNADLNPDELTLRALAELSDLGATPRLTAHGEQSQRYYRFQRGR